MGKRNMKKQKEKPVSTNVPESYLDMMRDISGQGSYAKGLRIATNLYKLAVEEPSRTFEDGLIGHNILYESFLSYAGARLAEVLDYEKDADHPLLRKDLLSSIDATIEEDALDESDARHGCWIPPAASRDEMKRFSVRAKPDALLLYSEVGENVNDGVRRVLAFYEDVVYRHVKGWKERRMYVVYQLFQADMIYQLSERLTAYLKKNPGRNPAVLTDSLCSGVDMLADKYLELEKKGRGSR